MMHTGKTALITGGAKNMGSAFAKMLARHGANVVIHFHNAEAEAEARRTLDDVVAAGSHGALVEGDLSRVDAIRNVFDEAARAFGDIDIVINAAGIVIKKPFVEVTEAEYDRAFAINAKAAFFVMQEAAKRIRDNGRIINLGTTLLGATTGFYGLYAGSKSPLEHFTRALAKEIGARGITVNTIAPGPIDTAFFHAAETPQSVAFLESMSVANRLGRVDEIVPLVEFLSSPGSGWVTAQTIFVNGGFLAR